jgi:hypothetical protein
MTQTSNQPEKNRSQYIFNMTLAAVAGQVGCLTLIIVLSALFGGLWLDNHYNTGGNVYTIGLMVASVPVTLVLMFWVVRKATSKIESKQSREEFEEEAKSGRKT